MSQEPEDVKPKLNLMIAFEGTSITVKVRPTMTFAKIFQAAEKKFEKDPGSFKFTYDGERVNAQSTPGDLGMEDGDQIDAHLEQIGGWRS
ncbi:ubiquitin-like protein [Macrolepiota fuliginosa MF-IS2]|uniref:Ubiquitin-like protein n=1 Tax=Macrolepiota fuliginosa MF-IS2 TaxID=1400762 RepID=A0A9P6C1C6_9AGAR|nr:ubiquitin-like protein [Macrolepiota fuliginosa MF-IS2]